MDDGSEEATPARIYGELQLLQKQRKASENKLRELDKQRPQPRGEGVRRTQGPGDEGWIGQGGDKRHDNGFLERDFQAGGAPLAGRWKHDMHQNAPPSGRGGDRPDDRTRDRDRSRPGGGAWGGPGGPQVRSVVSSVVSVVSPRGGGAGGEEEESGGRRKRRHEDDDDEGERGRDEESRPAKMQAREERPFVEPKQPLMDKSRMRPRMSNRLGSFVAVPARREAGPEGAQEPKAAEATVKRNRKMFGNLLGHLQKAKKQEETIAASDKHQARMEVESRAETKVAESTMRLRGEMRQKRIDDRKRELATIREIRAKQAQAVHLLVVARADRQSKALQAGGFILTDAEPKLFWRPKLFDGKIEKVKNKTRDMLGGELVLLRKRLDAERAEDVAAEEERKREMEARIAAAKEMAEARRRALEEGGDEEAEAVEREIEGQGGGGQEGEGGGEGDEDDHGEGLDEALAI